MALLTRWTWVWASFGCWWWTRKPGVLQSMGSQRVRRDWVAELNWTDSAVAKESACNARDLSLIPRSGKSAGEGIGSPPQYSGLENSMDGIVNGIAKSRTGLRVFHFHSLLAANLYIAWLLPTSLESALLRYRLLGSSPNNPTEYNLTLNF